jgi:hypothetical protein
MAARCASLTYDSLFRLRTAVPTGDLHAQIPKAPVPVTPLPQNLQVTPEGIRLGPREQAPRVLGMYAAEEAARMPKRIKSHVSRKIALRLPDLDHAKSSVLNSLSSPRSRRNYHFAMDQFITWYCSEPRCL